MSRQFDLDQATADGSSTSIGLGDGRGPSIGRVRRSRPASPNSSQDLPILPAVFSACFRWSAAGLVGGSLPISSPVSARSNHRFGAGLGRRFPAVFTRRISETISGPAGGPP